MEIKDLKDILTTIVETMQRLHNKVKVVQDAAVRLDRENLEIAIAEEEKATATLKNLEIRRIEIMEQLSLFYLGEIKTMNIKDFLLNIAPKLNDNELNELSQMADTIKDLAITIRDQNDLNRILIESARDFIKQTICSVIGTKQSLIDRKI